MKAFRLFLVFAIAAVALGMIPGAAFAQMFPAYTTGINIQNMSASATTISIDFYAAGAADGTGGAPAASVQDSIDPFGVKSYFPLTAVASGFNGSVVVSSQQPVAAVTNLANSTLTALDAYNGTSTGSLTVYLPLLHQNNGGFYSWYSVQNVGSGPATVNVDYTDNGTGVDKTITVAQNASVTVYQKNETHTAKFFAATLTSNQNIVVVAVQENPSNILAYTGFPSGSKNPIMPIINQNNSGYITGTQIYNLGTTDTNVTVSYKAGQAGTDCTETQTVPAQKMVVFTSGAFSKVVPNSTCIVGSKFIGSAQVTTNSTNQDLAVVVNQLRASNTTNGASYDAFDVAKANSTVFMPTIFDRNSGWYTAFNLLNVGSSTANIKCTYANQSVTSTATLAQGKSATISQFMLFPSVSKYIGSAVCKTYTDTSYTTEDTNGKILTVVNQLGPSGPDNLLSYDGINP